MGILRLLLALSVVAGHSSGILWLSLPGGASAVRIFFVISGFYMALVLNEKYVGAGSYRIFIANRFARIYPIYFLMAGVTLILIVSTPTEVQLLDPERLRQLSAGAKALVFGSNLGIFGLDAWELTTIDNGTLEFVRNVDPHTFPLNHLRLVPQAWTLSPELMFYVLAPFVVRQVPRLCALGVASVALRIVLLHEGLTSDAWTHQFFPTELAFFLLGALLYHVQRMALFQSLAPKLAPIALYGTGLGLFTFNSLPSVVSYGLIVGSIPFLFALTKRNSVDRLLGELSYPVYMVHFFLIFVVDALLPRLAASGSFGDVCAVVSIALSLVVYWSVVLPIDRWRDGRTATWSQTTRGPVPQRLISAPPELEAER